MGRRWRWLAIYCQAKAFWFSASGTTAIEYGLILGGIALAIVTIVFNLGEDVQVFYNEALAELFGAGADGGISECDNTSSASDKGLEKGKGQRCS